MSTTQMSDRYDVVIAGARVAGASTAMLLARAGLKVLVVDPVEKGRDTLSTHALMRGAVLQLHRWGLLDALKRAGTPAITKTTFFYESESTTVEIKARDGVDGLYAPRRTVLDPILVDGAIEAGADVAYGWAATGLVQDDDGRVRGIRATSREDGDRVIEADVVIGADGMHSRVARMVEAPVDYAVKHQTAVIYGYWRDTEVDEFHWYYGTDAAIGAIPTNDDDACVFLSFRPGRFHAARPQGLAPVYHELIHALSTDLAERLHTPSSKLRGFPGSPSLLRRSAGPGWALVGDAGYFKDPLTAHGITDALRDAELLARAVLVGTDQALVEYQSTRDDMSRALLDVTSDIASFDWTLDEVKDLHISLSKEMKKEVAELLSLGDAPFNRESRAA